MAPLSLIVDCDPGVDDAVALLLAFGRPELEFLGVTTVGGNVDGTKTARNARMLREIAGREDVPVHRGADRPLVRTPVAADHFHGAEGLGVLEPFEPAARLDGERAAAFLADTVMSRPAKSVALAVIGPMTNLAVALRLEPGLAERLGPVAVMGGARREGGNITASAEFNVHADPHAAEVVLGAALDLVFFGLDVTHQVRATPERIAAVEALGTRAAETAASMLRFSEETSRRLGDGGAAPLHDPCPVAWLIRPELFELVPAHVAVETASALTLGHTAVEFRERIAPPNARWATRADAQGVFDLITEALGR